MKIDRNKKNLNQFSGLPKNGVQEVKRGSEALFEQELNHRQEEALHLKMKEILGEIDKTAERLKRSMTIQDLMTYKKLIKNFLLEASAQAYHVEARRSRSRRGRNIMITVQTIDKEVENLMQDVISKNSEPIDILKALDKIRGMLLDLMI